jgi:glycerophosphoryl diester phosphodiesterase
MRSLVWTADRDADLHRALALGVDGVISNRPDALQKILRERLVPA